MYDRENLDAGMCGKLVYDYSYLRGMNEGYLNPFDIRIDMYTENTNKSVFESIARAIIVSGNNRVLTFHSDVNGDKNTSVKNFVDENEFKKCFDDVLKNEFPDKLKKYKKIKMVGLYSDIKPQERKKILKQFDRTPDNEVFVISSCETIGEGIDTKNANMCVFVDPKSSFVKIIQNIGRIVRKIFGLDKPNSTILIPCWVDKSKYIECNGDREKCDEVIRKDMSETGNFNGILNVLSALKQEDEEIYDICLYYPDTFSLQEIKSNLEKQGYTIDDQVGDGTCIETLEYLLENDIEYDYELDDEELIMNIAEDNDVCIEIHTNSLENPVEKYNSECQSGEIIRLYKTTNEDTEEEVYYPIIEKESKTKRNIGEIKAPNKNNRMKLDIHTNPDIKVLWNITSDFDAAKDICSCVIDCEVVKYDPLKLAMEIVERANEREKEGKRFLPREMDKKNRTTPELQQENKDAVKLGNWKKALKGKGNGNKCSDEVKNYLDLELPGWRDEIDFDKKAMEDAQNIIQRANERKKNGKNLLPRHIQNKKNRNTPELEQEYKDAVKLGMWKQALKGKGNSKCSDEVKNYLDLELLGWRDELDLDKKAMEDAKNIVIRANERKKNGKNLLPRKCCINKNKKYNEQELQEHKDAQKLGNWKSTLKGKGTRKCSDEVKNYLDLELLGWRDELDLDKKAMEDAQNIVLRANERKKNGKNLLPRFIDKKNRNTPELEQEYKDANKLGNWKSALKGKGNGSKCSDEVKNYLDLELPGWRDEIDFDKKAMEDAQNIIQRANERKKNGKNLLPRHIKNKKNRTTPELKQEYKDSQKLCDWKKALKGKGSGKCFDEVKNYLDLELPGWRDEIDFDKKAMEDAQNIIQRANERKENGKNLLPRHIQNKKNRTTPELEQENKDSQKLCHWKKALKGKGQGSKCSDEVKNYLDLELPGWRKTTEQIDTQSNTDSNTSKKKSLIIEDSSEDEEVYKIEKPKKSMKLKKSTKVIKETPEQKRERVKSEISQLHKEYKVLKSENLHNKFKESPELWHKYHEISEANESSFPEDDIPRNRIIKELDKIKSKRSKLTVDMGCGKAQIAKYFKNDKRFEFINYDHISSNDTVISCDISNIPLEEDSVEICILSLAMWGSNCEEYIQEASRILESNGQLYIIEPTKRWSEKDDVENIIPGTEAKRLKNLLEKNNFEIKRESIEKFCLFVCNKK
jgi:ribosomal RNA-processing protein 8